MHIREGKLKSMNFNWKEYKRFIESELTIVDKERNEVPFILNPVQAHLIEHLTPLNNVLKNRKQGVSSLALGIGVTKFIMGENERIASVSFVKDSALQQLQRAKHFIKSYEEKHGIELPMKYNSKNEMVLEGETEDGRGYINTLRVGSAKSDSFGRGDDITFLHITEAAHADHLERLLSGIGEAVTNDAITIMETTAQGFNDYKKFWDRTDLGETGYKNFFYDPFWTYDEEFVKQRRKTLGRLGPQEFPYTAQEAFITSGDTYFDMTALRWYLDNAQEPKGA